jgi:hypothetical protein
MQHLAGHNLCLIEANRTARSEGGIAHSDHSVKPSNKPAPEPVVAFTTPLLINSSPNASIHPTLCINQSKLLSNATCLDFVLNDCTNIRILVWPVLANASITSSDSHSRNLASVITTLLPYVEVCGLLALIWRIGMFVHAKVYKRWNKRSRSPTQECGGLRSDRELLAL